MKIIEHLNRLDSLIVENTAPPATSKLRNYLSAIIEQAETEGDLPDAVARKDAEHAQTVAALQAENAKLKKKLAEDSSCEDFKKEEDNYLALLRGKMLNHKVKGR
jgi:hypothetical protein